MSFDVLELHPSLHKAIAQSGYTTPTPIQAEAIPAILTGQDLIASAQTGTGKTAAFMLPALQRFTAPATGNRRLPRVLVLTPTRELANQIIEAARKYGKFLRFNAASFLGGMPYRQQLRQLSGPLDLVVATPGRLLDHLDRGRIDLSGIELLVLDEADRMLDMGFIDDVEKIAAATPASRQTLLFSATLDRLVDATGQALAQGASAHRDRRHHGPPADTSNSACTWPMTWRTKTACSSTWLSDAARPSHHLHRHQA